MSNNNKYRTTFYIGFIFLLIIIFFVGRCTKKDTIIIKKEIVIERITGSSDTITNPKPIFTSIKDSIRYKDSIIVHNKEFDKDMVIKYNDLNDEYEKLREYIKAVEVNIYSIPIEDENLLTNNYFKVQGKLINFKQDYEIKERKLNLELEVPKQKVPVFSLYGGIGLETNFQLEKLEPSINIHIQNKKGDLLGVDLGLEKTLKVTYSKKIFDIKK